MFLGTEKTEFDRGATEGMCAFLDFMSKGKSSDRQWLNSWVTAFIVSGARYPKLDAYGVGYTYGVGLGTLYYDTTFYPLSREGGE